MASLTPPGSPSGFPLETSDPLNDSKAIFLLSPAPKSPVSEDQFTDLFHDSVEDIINSLSLEEICSRFTAFFNPQDEDTRDASSTISDIYQSAIFQPSDNNSDHLNLLEALSSRTGLLETDVATLTACKQSVQGQDELPNESADSQSFEARAFDLLDIQTCNAVLSEHVYGEPEPSQQHIQQALTEEKILSAKPASKRKKAFSPERKRSELTRAGFSESKHKKRKAHDEDASETKSSKDPQDQYLGKFSLPDRPSRKKPKKTNRAPEISLEEHWAYAELLRIRDKGKGSGDPVKPAVPPSHEALSLDDLASGLDDLINEKSLTAHAYEESGPSQQSAPQATVESEASLAKPVSKRNKRNASTRKAHSKKKTSSSKSKRAKCRRPKHKKRKVSRKNAGSEIESSEAQDQYLGKFSFELKRCKKTSERKGYAPEIPLEQHWAYAELLKIRDAGRTKENPDEPCSSRQVIKDEPPNAAEALQSAETAISVAMDVPTSNAALAEHVYEEPVSSQLNNQQVSAEKATIRSAKPTAKRKKRCAGIKKGQRSYSKMRASSKRKPSKHKRHDSSLKNSREKRELSSGEAAAETVSTEYLSQPSLPERSLEQHWAYAELLKIRDNKNTAQDLIFEGKDQSRRD